MTGALTLSGQVLSIGGIAEKVLAASWRVILPEPNREQVHEELSDDVRRAVLSPVDELLEPALMPANDGAAEASGGQMARARLTATVSRASDVALEGFDEVHSTLCGVRDLLLPTMTHMRLQRVADGIINLHGRTHDAAVTRTRQVSTSVEPIRCWPVEPEGSGVRLASRWLAGACLARPRPNASITYLRGNDRARLARIRSCVTRTSTPVRQPSSPGIALPQRCG